MTDNSLGALQGVIFEMIKEVKGAGKDDLKDTLAKAKAVNDLAGTAIDNVNAMVGIVRMRNAATIDADAYDDLKRLS